MVLELDMIDETEDLAPEAFELVENLLQFAADKLNIQNDSELTVTFVDNARIQEINRDYRDKDQPTDVISFALEEMGDGEVAITWSEDMEVPRILGDIIISTERAEEQAKEYGHGFDREVGFLALHGLLHLLGYDHIEDEDEKEMFALQKEVLDAYGLER
ncbi:rRNA maturation RNase YbeY [Listeria booriae]|uniref:rRNA maturation RNase YbeY n=1 Tax=Listeria booriae TaxID=1552123 RepID=UPI001627B0FB|nr:rRNA maturation RNase YbeY [Listeria booriae]MBC1293113.1 rRNA maturation RNase YbeY [Listeria booriae]MBC1335963.1 rRNA maturation RNase YbeY [Listeria booriae]MBC1650220.1 rRNA maturation RNase YbeY [Listeria booriae]MBC1946027.1 rRNA maturation RNase YbeY [Listeria booriae]MBC6127323.1 rRNA maturation RNase YbeY [Listeria booriae]